MAIDNRLIALTSLNQFFVDKDTGAPLSGGTLEFYRDKNNAASKNVYKLDGTQPDYSYTNIGAVITLGADGTAQDSSGNNIIIYGFPYTDTPSETSTTLDLYYIVCKDSGGAIQWTRDAIPTITSEGDILDEDLPTSNQISNPQFSRTFLNSGSNAITIQSKTNYEVSIAPDWTLVLTGTGTVTVTQTAVSGSSDLPTLAPFYLSVAVGAGITQCLLRQRLNNNSGLWGESSTFSTNTGRLSSYVVAKADSSRNISFYYKDNSQTAAVLQTMSLTTSWQAFSEVVDIDETLSSTTSSTGYVDLYFDISTGATLDVTSVQVIPAPTSTTSAAIPYDQRSSNRELAYMSDYYTPALSNRGTGNILIGWDFPVNPNQLRLASSTITANSASSAGAYVWDQTICGRAGSDITFARTALTGGIRFTTTGATSSLTMIQYLEPETASALQGQELSVNVNAYTSGATDVVGRIYLVYAESTASIPSLLTSTVIGSTTTEGIFTPTATGWTLVPRQYMPTPEFTLNVAIGRDTLKTSTTDFGFNGWLMDGQLSGNPSYLAIVVTFEMPTSGTNLNVDSINLTTGSIPSRPIPMSKSQVLSQCQRYYEKSYNQTTTPGTAVGSNNTSANAVRFPIYSMMYQDSGGTNVGNALRCTWGIEYKTEKRATPTVTIYSPAGTSDRLQLLYRAGAASIDVVTDTVSSTYTARDSSTKRISYTTANSAVFDTYTPTFGANGFRTYEGVFHYVADARLGIV